MSLFFIPAFLFLFAYSILLLFLGVGFFKTSRTRPLSPTAVPLSIIVCARNEENTIVRCLQSILEQEYDRHLIQLILVNDASGDATFSVAEKELKHSGIDFTILNNSEQLGKKKSITLAIAEAKHELLVMRDADTYTSSTTWLSTLAAFYKQTNSDLIIAPVKLADAGGLLWALQAIENNVLAVFAAGSAYYHKAFLCNGANMAFKKTIFQKVGGYAAHLHVPSGDDVLFLEDVKKIAGSKIAYLRSEDATVTTHSQTSISALFHQKVRWASKFKTNENSLNLSLAVLSTLVNFTFLLALCQFLVRTDYYFESALFIVFKIMIDFLILFLASGFIKNQHLWWHAFPISFLYPLYALIIALASILATPNRKL